MVAGKTHYGKIDSTGAFWQCSLAPECQKYFGISTDRGVWVSQHMLQGARNSPSQFQTIMTTALGDLVGIACLVFFDDILVFGESESEYVDNMLSVQQRLHSKGFKASVKKRFCLLQRCYSVASCTRLMVCERIRVLLSLW